MLNLTLILIFSVTVFAQNLEFSIENNRGESFYSVKSDNTQQLESKLIFPFNFNSFDVKYNHAFDNFILGLEYSFLLNSNSTKGEDYDWKENLLTVFSYSSNEVNNYYKLGANISSEIFKDLFLVGQFEYQELDFEWKDTYQEDYIKAKNLYVSGKNLQFKQIFYTYSIGLDKRYKLSNKISLSLYSAFLYTFIEIKDKHILRDFYTMQNAKTLGYHLGMELNYQINNDSYIITKVNSIKIEDKSVNMDYYNVLNEKYLSYPSMYSYENQKIKIGYKYIF